MSYGIMPYAVKMSEIVSDLQSKDEAVVSRLKSYCASEFSGEEELAELAFKNLRENNFWRQRDGGQ